MFKFLSSQSKFRIIAKTKGRTAFFDFKSEKEVNRWLNECGHLVDEEIQIFQRDDIAYQLVYSESKRKVGF